QTKKETFTSRTSEKIRAEFGVIGGASMIDLKFKTATSSNIFYNFTTIDFENNISFAGGATLNLVFPRNNGKLSFYNELFYCSDVSNYDYKEYYNNGYFQLHSISIGGYYIKLNNMLRYKYPIGDLFCFGNAGISNGLAFKEVNKAIGVDRYNNQTAIIEKKFLDNTNSYEQGWLLGAGLLYKCYSIEFRMEICSGMSNYPSLSSLANRYDLLFGYKF
ncbi:MAG: hypothetical protein ACOYMD_11460, partial [Paludibacter sp.]